MPLLARLTFPETLAQMAAAAPQRLAEGEALVEREFWDAGIYLLGYAAEMILKTSYCRIDPSVPPTLPVETRFGPAKSQWQRNYGPAPVPDQYKHSLIFWEGVISLERAAQGKPPLSPSVALLLSRCVRLISNERDVRMRYQPAQATADEARRVLVAVRWLTANQRDFWS